MLKTTKMPKSPHLGYHYLQTVSIIGIIMNNLWPHVFANGHFGYDICFIITGYSAAMSRPYKNFGKLKSYFLKQIQALIPMHLIAIAVNLPICAYLYTPMAYMTLVIQSFWALIFVKSVEVYLNDLNPMNYLSEGIFFMHVWLITSQMAFTVIAPLLCYLAKGSHKTLSVVLALGIASFISKIIYSSSPKHWVTVFPCIWQNSLGIIAYSLTNSTKIDISKIPFLDNLKSWINKKKELYFVSVGILIFFTFVPLCPLFHNSLIRLAITVSTIFILILHPTKSIFIYFDKAVIYVSEMFYILYLVNPLLILINYYLNRVSFPFIFVITFGKTFIISIIANEVFYKPVQKLSGANTAYLIAGLYAFILYLFAYLMNYPLY